MSRIGEKPISVPAGVTATVNGQVVAVQGPKGKLQRDVRPEIGVRIEGNVISVVRNQETRLARGLHGLTRTLIQNMVSGVVSGYEKRLEIVGVGYIAAVQKGTLQLRVGYANEIQIPIPTGLEVTCPDQTHVVVRGCDKQLVGQFAAMVRSKRKPEPYKGKGVRYQGEHVKIKPGKTAT